MATCQTCSANFTISPEDQNFYQKIEVPQPVMCPDCRQQRRIAWRNERSLFHRSCDLCEKNIISIYRPGTIFPVYCNSCWWGDQWNPLDYGFEYNPNESFFPQYKKLQSQVPRLFLHQKNVENSEYTNHSENLKNCYLCIDVCDAENVYYSNLIVNVKDSCDCYNISNSSLCYENLYAVNNYNCRHTIISKNCSDSAFLYDCRNCQDCFLCHNLRHKQYCINNKQYSPEQYHKIISQIDLGSFAITQKFLKKFNFLVKEQAIHKHQNITQSEKCTGNFISESKNVQDSFEIIKSEDCRYCYFNWYLKDCYDTSEAAFGCELQYESHACNRGTRTIAAHASYDVDQIYYSDSCHNSSELFGCIGLKQKKYCILNQQYSKDDYKNLKSRIIEQMKKDHEYGHFFPIELSPYPYQDTIANQFYPLSEGEIKSRKYHWHNKPPKSHSPATCALPDSITEITEAITKEALSCQTCQKNYRLTKQETAFYKQQSIPIPRHCPNCRHLKRANFASQTLYSHHCTNCSKQIKTSYNPTQYKNIFCEECYLNSIN